MTDKLDPRPILSECFKVLSQMPEGSDAVLRCFADMGDSMTDKPRPRGQEMSGIPTRDHNPFLDDEALEELRSALQNPSAWFDSAPDDDMGQMRVAVQIRFLNLVQRFLRERDILRRKVIRGTDGDDAVENCELRAEVTSLQNEIKRLRSDLNASEEYGGNVDHLLRCCKNVLDVTKDMTMTDCAEWPEMTKALMQLMDAWPWEEVGDHD
jgi:hypothetical protein